MDLTRFAAMSRILGAIGSRRGLVRGGLAALGIGVLGGSSGEADAAPRRRRRRRRRGAKNGSGGGGGLGAENCTVCDDEDDCPFTSIQAAIDAAQLDGTEIAVCPGTLKERISIGPTNPPNLSIVGAGPQNTTIDGDGEGSVITVGRATFVMVTGFTITGGKADFGGGINNRGFLTIDNCVVTDNDTGAADSGGGGGIYNDGGNLTLQLAQVTDNHALDGQGGGILNVGGTLALRENTQVTKNMADQGGGLFNQGGTVTIDSISGVSDNEPDNCVGTIACGA